MQVEGTKEIWVEDLPAVDRVVHHRSVIEYFRQPGAGVPTLPPATRLELGPGDGLYIPPTAFHWTRVSARSSSVALSVGFSTDRTIRDTRVSNFDVVLHRLGWRTRPAGPTKRAIVEVLARRNRHRP